MSDWDASEQLSAIGDYAGVEEISTNSMSSVPGEGTLDSELEAAIEYKIATSGMDGVTEILDLVSEAVRRRGSLALDEPA